MAANRKSQECNTKQSVEKIIVYSEKRDKAKDQEKHSKMWNMTANLETRERNWQHDNTFEDMRANQKHNRAQAHVTTEPTKH